MIKKVNPVLSMLGLKPSQKAVVFHADDIGMLNSTVTAWTDLADSSAMTSASVMAPCPWFPAAAREMSAHKNADVGVHMTLNSEWEKMRYAPLSTSDMKSALFDEEGYFPNNTKAVQDHVDPDEVAVELKAQMDRTLAAGVDVTHIDSHMGTVFHPRLLESYVRVGFAYQVPALVMRANRAKLIEMGFQEEIAGQVEAALDFIENQGMPLFDSIQMMPLREATTPAKRLKLIKKMLEDYGPGLHYLIFHPAEDSSELHAVAPDWKARAGDYKLLKNPKLDQIIKDAGITPIGMREVRDAFRKTLG